MLMINGKITTGLRVQTPFESAPSMVKLNASEIARLKRAYEALPKVKYRYGVKLDEPHVSRSAVGEQFIVEYVGVKRAMDGGFVRANQKAIIMKQVALWEAGQPIAKQRRSLKTRKRR